MDQDSNIQRILNSEEFENLFRSYFEILCRYAVKYTRDLDSAKEVVHTVFVNVWEKRETLRSDQNIRSYLYTSVYNRCLNYLRDSRKTVELEEVTDQEVHGHPDNPGTSLELEGKELQARIDAAIESLPDRCRQIFKLSRYEDLKYAGIAEKLGISIKTVEVQMSKALKLLRENLAEFLSLLIIILLTR